MAAMSVASTLARPSIDARLRDGFRRQSDGDLTGAEAVYRDVLAEAPEEPRALTLLAAVRESAEDRDAARDLYRRALQASPEAPAPRLKLANLILTDGDAEAALNLIRPFTAAAPNEPQGWRVRARAAYAAKQYAEAAECWGKLEALGDPRAASHLGKALQALGNHAGAAVAYRRLLAREPDNGTVVAALGDALAKSRDKEGAIEALARAVELEPDHKDARAALGYELSCVGWYEEAATVYTAHLPNARNVADLLNNLGNCRLAQGRPRLAQSIYRQALVDDPHNQPAVRNLCMATAYDDGKTSADLAAACRMAVAGLEIAPRPPIPAISDRPVRVGLVSADLRAHSVAAFVEPLFAHADAHEIDLRVYSLVSRPDAVTARLQVLVDRWVDIHDLETEAAFDAIRADGVDVLIDLAGQTSDARFDVFARRPAAVQASWLGWPATTGFAAIDFKLSDELLTPEDTTETLTERPMNLAGPAICFQPPDDAPPVADAPILTNGYPTFGSFNRVFKASARTLALWAGVLAACPTGRLLIKDGAFRCAATTARFQDRLVAAGIDPARATLLPSTATRAEHLEVYGQVDVALDSVPYNGVTTTSEALWMGVPTVTMPGDQALSRYGLSVLTAAGQSDCVATDPADFAARAAGLVADPPRLAERRGLMRRTVAESALLDGPAFARNFAKACRDMVETVRSETS